ncbi:hypothetical protein [Flavimarina sp. Hel_I_48]|uniref:hypothetical protein n=1 Tax=Flavimarina sp. Hel_I_48 TaxID=1392488 RepID=UPI0004DF63E2|nr:hypothetical protein [Flavimarina sp. Hel_I_48]
MAVDFIEYKQAQLRSNCPECYSSDGLTLVFSYKNEKNKLFERSTEEVKTRMYCTTCDTIIPPSRWTDDIERVFEYNKKLAAPPEPYFKFKPLSLILLLGVITVGIGAAFLIIKTQ